MPPRKRAASAAEATEEPQAPEVEQPEIEAPDEPAADGPPSEETVPDAEGADTPALSDLQEVEQPCPECVPNGWPEGAFSVGCIHGTWVRDSA